MTIKKIITASLAAVMAGTMLTSCSQPNLENLLPFNDEPKVKEYSSVVEGSALTIYVDVNAKDGGDGSESAPFKTIPEAQAKIREIKSGEGLPVGGITVLVKDGKYTVTEPITFTEEDSGTEEAPITYVSENEFGAIITGGIILSAEDFEPLSAEERDILVEEHAKDRVVKVDLKKYGLTSDDWGLLYSSGAAWGSNYENGTGPKESEVFMNGKRLHIARWPNDDYIKTYSVIDNGVAAEYFTNDEYDNIHSSTDSRYAPEDRNIMNAQGGIFTVFDEVVDRAKLWPSLDDLWLFGYFKWAWAEANIPVKVFDLDAKSIELAQAQQYGVSKGAPFYFYNVLAELDSENEYYIERDTGMMYIYKPENFESSEIMMSCTLENLLNATNISYITLKGFGACATRSSGFAMNGHDFIIDNCKIYNVRSGGIAASGNNITIQNCEISDVGGYGINISGGDASTLTPSGNLVYNNYIHDFGVVDRTYSGAIHVGGCGVTVSHNEMANAPHLAVAYSGPLHMFEYNEVYDVCMETSDAGAFYHYQSMDDYGTVFRYNYIHDIGTGDKMAFGIYWDGSVSGQTAYGNVIVNAAGRAFLANGGRDNIIENNIIINCGGSIHYSSHMRHTYLNGSLDHIKTMANDLIRIQQNEYWTEKFPILAKLIPYTENAVIDPEDPNFMANPAGSIVKNNITYNFSTNYQDIDLGKVYHKFDYDDVVRFSEVENNPFILRDSSDFPGWHNGDYTMIGNSKAKELCPDFEPIPFDQIGRIE